MVLPVNQSTCLQQCYGTSYTAVGDDLRSLMKTGVKLVLYLYEQPVVQVSYTSGTFLLRHAQQQRHGFKFQLGPLFQALTNYHCRHLGELGQSAPGRAQWHLAPNDPLPMGIREMSFLKIVDGAANCRAGSRSGEPHPRHHSTTGDSQGWRAHDSLASPRLDSTNAVMEG